MKLSYEDKVKIYEMRKSGVTWSQIHDQFGVNTNNLRYMFRLIERHGIEIIKKTTNRHYPPELKQEFKSLKQLKRAIEDYIHYYNHKRIKVNLKGLSPVQYRTKSLA